MQIVMRIKESTLNSQGVSLLVVFIMCKEEEEEVKEEKEDFY